MMRYSHNSHPRSEFARFVIVLGIDPGTRKIGYGVIEETGGRLRHVSHGVIRTDPENSRQENLLELQTALINLAKHHKPQKIGLEKIFFSKNVRTAMGVSEARGVILLTAKELGVPLVEFTPLEVKQAVTGSGAADKKQVQKMVTFILRLEEEPRPDDAADALAIAICCASNTSRQNLSAKS